MKSQPIPTNYYRISSSQIKLPTLKLIIFNFLPVLLRYVIFFYYFCTLENAALRCPQKIQETLTHDYR